MSSERARELEERGIEAARAGQKDEARRLLQHSLRLESANDNAWLWLASVAKDKRERLLCLQKVLELNPQNEMGLKAVQAMGIDPARLLPERQTIDDTLISEDDAELEGVPIPTQEFLAAALPQVTNITEPYVEPPEATNIDWKRKEKGRTGEREIWILRTQIGAALGVFGAIVLSLIVFTVSNSPEVQLVLFGASETPIPASATPTPSLTPRPNINPTETPTVDFTANPTFTPTPTPDVRIDAWPLDQFNTPEFVSPTPTDLYLGVRDNAVATAIVAQRNEQDYDVAIERMQIRQQETVNDFEPFPFYYEAVLLVRQGNEQGALDRLDAAQNRLDNVESINAIDRADARRFQPVINAGYMNVYLDQIRDAVEVGNLDLAVSRLSEMQTLATQANEIDRSYEEPYILLAEAYIELERYDQAITYLESTNEIGELRSSVPLIVETGQAYLARGIAENDQSDLARADYLGFLGTYINPFNRAAHELRVESALARNQPGLAAIYTDQYLVFQPESANALRLLAQARLDENKPEFALDIYTEALGQDVETSALAETYLSRAELYFEARRYDLAIEDLTRTLDLQPSLRARYLRMLASYNAGDFQTAQEDADILIDANYVEQDEARLIRAQIIVDEEQINRYETALEDLILVTNSLPADDRSIANFYQARIFYQQELYGDALNAVNRALDTTETGSRRYLRALIYRAQDDRDTAIEEFEWILRWDAVYDYPFGDEARAQLDAIQAEIQQEFDDATATAASATQAIIDLTATAEAETTPTPEPDDG